MLGYSDLSFCFVCVCDAIREIRNPNFLKFELWKSNGLCYALHHILRMRKSFIFAWYSFSFDGTRRKVVDGFTASAFQHYFNLWH